MDPGLRLVLRRCWRAAVTFLVLVAIGLSVLLAISNPLTDGQGTPASANGTTLTLSTSATVPSGAKIWVLAGYFHASATATFSGGGLTWTTDSTVTNGSVKLALGWADAPSGLASTTTLTVTFSATSGSRFFQAMYSTGVATGAASSRISGTTGTTAWTSGAQTVPSGSILIGGCRGDGNSATNTASGGNTEVHDQNIAADSAQTSCYQLGTGASIAAQGTWTAGLTNAATGVVFAASGGAVAVPEVLMAPMRR